MRNSSFLAAASGALLLLAAAQPHAAPFAYITEQAMANVRVIDTATDTVVANIAVGGSPAGVTVNRTGTRAYVSNAQDGTVSVIDTTTNRVVATIAVGLNPTGLAVNSAGTRVYVANSNSNPGLISVIDTATNIVIANMPVGVTARSLALTPDGRRLYVGNGLSRTISVIDTGSFETVETIPVAAAAEGSLAIDAAGTRLYASVPNSDTPLVVIDIATNRIIGSVNFGSGSAGVALNPAGTRVYVADFGGDSYSENAVFVIDTASLAIIAKVPVGNYPTGIAVHPSGSRIYVTNFQSSNVSVIDAATNTVTNTIAVGRLPSSLGDFIGPADAVGAAGNYQGLWWKSGGTESGWGLNLTHQGDILFATWFTYDADGSGLWLVMPRGTKTGIATYSGTFYRTTGPAFSADPWNSSTVTVTETGTGTFAFTDLDNGTFTYTLNGITQTKAIERQVFGTVPTCTANGTPDVPANYQDLWWRSPAGSQSGWGVNLTHQGDVLFATWFTYDASGKALWLVMPRGTAAAGSNTYSGPMYRTTGPAFNAVPWNPAQVTVTQAGTATFSFVDTANAAFTYTIAGATRSQAITRQEFASPSTVCR